MRTVSKAAAAADAEIQAARAVAAAAADEQMQKARAAAAAAADEQIQKARAAAEIKKLQAGSSQELQNREESSDQGLPTRGERVVERCVCVCVCVELCKHL